jgi:hypothetical protein
VWGEEHDHGGPFLILVNGKTLAVRHNLHAFLRVAKTKYPNRKFWIDALCIDQTNTAERNQQVQQMGEIYTKAKEVIAWLGDEQTGAEVIPFVSRRTCHIFRYLVVDLISEFSSRRRQMREKQLDDFNDAVNKYWSRAWITQEIALAKRVYLLAHKTEWNLSTVKRRHARRIPRVFGSNRQVSLNLLYYTHTRGYYGSGQYLLMLLSQYRDKKCSIERDRIFSLLSICEEGPNLEVDYNLSDERLLREVLRVSFLSPCLCLAEAASQGVNVNAVSRKNLRGRYFVRLTVDPTHISPWKPAWDPSWNPISYKKTPQCAYCQSDLDESWNDRNSGLLFCLSNVCSEIRGHLFWEYQTSLNPHTNGLFHCLGYSSTTSILLGPKGDLVDVEADRHQELFILHFTIEALLKLFRARNEDIPPPRLCGKTTPHIDKSSRVEFLDLEK